MSKIATIFNFSAVPAVQKVLTQLTAGKETAEARYIQGFSGQVIASGHCYEEQGQKGFYIEAHRSNMYEQDSTFRSVVLKGLFRDASQFELLIFTRCDNQNGPERDILDEGAWTAFLEEKPPVVIDAQLARPFLDNSTYLEPQDDDGDFCLRFGG